MPLAKSRISWIIQFSRASLPLAQEMACCLTASSHYLRQCWLHNSEVSGIHVKAILQRVPQLLRTIMGLKIRHSKLLPHFSKDNELKTAPHNTLRPVDVHISVICKMVTIFFGPHCAICYFWDEVKQISYKRDLHIYPSRNIFLLFQNKISPLLVVHCSPWSSAWLQLASLPQPRWLQPANPPVVEEHWKLSNQIRPEPWPNPALGTDLDAEL